MSAIAGIFYRDTRPVPMADLQVLAAHNRAFGADGGGAHLIDGLVMQSWIQAFDDLSEHEQQPYRFGQGSVLTWDGRLDNRADLLLRLHRDLGGDISDAALVAAAYAKWGLDSLRMLVGDWSAAIWDASNRRLIVASDYMVNRPVYFVDRPDAFAWSTSLDALAERFDLYSQPDEAFIAGRLTYGVPPGTTPFRSASMLFGGHYLVVTQNAPADLRRYWSFEPVTIRYPRLHDYSDHLRELITEAVKVRLRSNRPVWAHLSGGWDSSAVVCVSKTLIDDRTVSAPELRTVTVVSSTAPEANQDSYVEAVERWCGLTSVKHDMLRGGYRLTELLGHLRPFPHIARTSLESVVQNAGGRVVLTGRQGDLVMFKTGLHYASLLEPLHDGRPLNFLSGLATFCRHRQRTIAEALGLLIPNYLPQSFADRRSRQHLTWSTAMSSRRLWERVAAHFGVNADFVMRTKPRPFQHSVPVSAFPFVKRSLASSLYRSGFSAFFSNSDLVPDVRATHPLTHRPLAEFVLGVPQLAFWEPTFSRAGMRRALIDVLPPEILERRRKEEVAPALTAAIRPLIEEVASGDTSQWEMVKRGYLDEAPFSQMLRNLVNGRSDKFGFAHVCIQLEAWLRALATHSPNATMTGNEFVRTTITRDLEWKEVTTCTASPNCSR